MMVRSGRRHSAFSNSGNKKNLRQQIYSNLVHQRHKVSYSAIKYMYFDQFLIFFYIFYCLVMLWINTTNFVCILVLFSFGLFLYNFALVFICQISNRFELEEVWMP